MMTWNDNYLDLNDRHIEFNNKIYKVIEIKSYIFVLLGFSFDPSTHCNIYCLNQQGQILWQIKRKDINGTSKSMTNAYIGLMYQNGRYSATNFYNEVIYFNPFNGKIIS